MTVIYIHGINNKPRPEVLKQRWDEALFGAPMGARTRMAYWADLRYGEPLPDDLPSDTGARSLSLSGAVHDPDEPLPPEAEAYARAVEERMSRSDEEVTALLEEDRGVGAASVEQKILPPGPIRRFLTRLITRAFIRDTAAYFYDAQQREAMRDRVRGILVPGSGPYLVVAHSQGSILAYDVLRELERDTSLEITGLVTLGSPLGIEEVRDNLGRGLDLEQRLAMPVRLEHWSNFAERLDPVALDATLADDYPPQRDGQPSVRDHRVRNPDTFGSGGFDPHSSVGYLSTAELQAAVHAALDPAFTDLLGDGIIARDVARHLGHLSRRIPVLIALDDRLDPVQFEGRARGNTSEAQRTSQVKPMAARKARVLDAVAEVVRREAEEGGEHPDRALDAAQVDDGLQRYVAARLRPREIDRLAAVAGDLKVHRIWKNQQRRALLDRSIHTVQAHTAQLGYGADGAGIEWAVLDTGARADHPHFIARETLRVIWDCTVPGPPILAWPGDDQHEAALDPNGHGTHVAGIIAGGGPRTSAPNAEHIRGIAPNARLHVYRVLTSDGFGDDAWIIKALDHVAETNEQAGRLVIHGVNLSLGGPFEAEVYACGHSPICRELRRLWSQGVVVVVAAGNEGREAVHTARGLRNLNFDLSIGDPANLEDAIAVGSVHRESPDLYGISFFSSRGPTADGRQKPDVVAPGERIVSCRSDWSQMRRYVALSGTSMACPHVSGIVAAFLSARRGYRGYPERVKAVLLDNCTDLRREPAHQGRGLPNLTRMLLATGG